MARPWTWASSGALKDRSRFCLALRPSRPRQTSRSDLQRISVLQPGRESAKFHAHRASAISIELLSRILKPSGSLGYSTANNSVPDFNEIVNDYVSRNGSRGSTAGGPADTKRVSVNADWSGVYSFTDKFQNSRFVPLRQLAHSRPLGYGRDKYLRPNAAWAAGFSAAAVDIHRSNFYCSLSRSVHRLHLPRSHCEFLCRHSEWPHIEFPGTEH